MRSNDAGRMPAVQGKKFALTACLLFVCSTLMAQGPSVTKQINNIKRNPQYLYEEATHENAAEAESMAYELLFQRVNDYVASRGKLKNAKNVVVKDIKQKGEVLSMMRGTMYRVFVYVLKSDIEGVTNTTVINSGSGTTVTVADGATSLVDVQQVNPLPQTTQPKVENKDAGKMPAVQSVAEDKDAGRMPAVQSPLTGWKQEAIERLLECKDVAAVRARLNRMKAEYKVKRYGSADNCPSVSESWWAIFDGNGNLVTILGPGTRERIDYKTMQYSSLDSFKGMNALWFNLAK